MKKNIMQTKQREFYKSNKKIVDELFNKYAYLINMNSKNVYFNGSHDEKIQELNIILLKACVGWYLNNVGSKVYSDTKDGKPTKVYFEYHYYQYVKGFFSRKNKQKKHNYDLLEKDDLVNYTEVVDTIIDNELDIDDYFE